LIDTVECEIPSVGDIRRLHDHHPDARLVLLVRADQERQHLLNANEQQRQLNALRREVDGWIVHTARSGILIKSLELIAMGKWIFLEDTLERGAPSGAEVSLKAVGVGSALPNPSTREMEVLRSLAKGSPNKIIARDLSIAEATVKVHVKAILRKTPFQNRTEVAQRAQETGIFHEAS
jgi:two-component system nitrate/nitrite response regulator NarL